MSVPGRSKYVQNRRSRVGRQLHPSGEIIAGADGDVGQGNTVRVRDSVDYFVDRPVAAYDDQGAAFILREDLPGDGGGVAFVSCQKGTLYCIVFFQDAFKLIPDL